MSHLQAMSSAQMCRWSLVRVQTCQHARAQAIHGTDIIHKKPDRFYLGKLFVRVLGSLFGLPLDRSRQCYGHDAPCVRIPVKFFGFKNCRLV